MSAEATARVSVRSPSPSLARVYKAAFTTCIAVGLWFGVDRWVPQQIATGQQPEQEISPSPGRKFAGATSASEPGVIEPSSETLEARPVAQSPGRRDEMPSPELLQARVN